MLKLAKCIYVPLHALKRADEHANNKRESSLIEDTTSWMEFRAVVDTFIELVFVIHMEEIERLWAQRKRAQEASSRRMAEKTAEKYPKNFSTLTKLQSFNYSQWKSVLCREFLRCSEWADIISFQLEHAAKCVCEVRSSTRHILDVSLFFFFRCLTLSSWLLRRRFSEQVCPSLVHFRSSVIFVVLNCLFFTTKLSWCALGDSVYGVKLDFIDPNWLIFMLHCQSVCIYTQQLSLSLHTNIWYRIRLSHVVSWANGNFHIFHPLLNLSKISLWANNGTSSDRFSMNELQQ